MDRRHLPLIIISLAGLLILAGSWWSHVRGAPPVPVERIVVAESRSLLKSLPIVEPLPLDDYDRSFFGPAWQRAEPHPCDTRNEVLQEWFIDFDTVAGSTCSVETGHFIDPYTGNMVEFLRGPRTSAEIHVDHVVALADAWRKGAATWSTARAQEFANDPLNLLPTQGWVNQEKGALDASKWLPHNEGFHCFFAIQQIFVKDKYGLGVSDAELSALQEALESCEGVERG